MTLDLREAEIRQVASALLGKQSMLVLGEPGSGKTTLGGKVKDWLEGMGYTVAIGSYGGAAKQCLVEIAEQLGAPTMTADEKPKAMNAVQLKDSLLKYLASPKTLLIIDDAHRFPASLRYWLEDGLRKGGLLLLLAYQPPARDIFLKLPRIEMQPLKNDEIRSLMYQEAVAHGMMLNPSQFAELQQRAGNNPALAKRVVHEALLGIGEAQSTDHHQYIDGTPFLVAALTAIGIIRFVGLGLGDKSLYIIGGIAMIAAMVLRTLMYAVNRRSSRL